MATCFEVILLKRVTQVEFSLTRDASGPHVRSAFTAAKSSGLKAQGRGRWARSTDHVIDN
jgi:hypothetical protein